LDQVALAIAVLLDSLARRLNRWEKIFDRMTTFLADLVTEFEALHFPDAANTESIVIRATALGTRRRYDTPGIVILGRFICRIFDDILRQPMRPLF
jgi:hypothetical protein